MDLQRSKQSGINVRSGYFWVFILPYFGCLQGWGSAQPIWVSVVMFGHPHCEECLLIANWYF